METSFYLPETELQGMQTGIQNFSMASISSGKVATASVECLDENLSYVTLHWCITTLGILASFSADPAKDDDQLGGAPVDGLLFLSPRRSRPRTSHFLRFLVLG
jgi:hypothetical protein